MGKDYDLKNNLRKHREGEERERVVVGGLSRVRED